MSLLSRRDVAIWAASFLLAAATIVFVRFTSDDPDSALYADLSARLADGPASHWIAPEWWDNWDHSGWFREHPAGVFLLPTLLGAAGIPGTQAAYVVGMGAGLVSLLLIARLMVGPASLGEARAALILLQLMPLASIFRIRANHEYPMLVCLLIALIGADAVRSSWRWFWVTPAALVGALLIKGVFVAVPLVALAWWILLNPRQQPGSSWRPLAATFMGFVAMGLTAVAYDAAYLHVTGERFWGPYWERQLAPLTIATPTDDGGRLLSHAGFYALRLLWHPAPWCWLLLAAAWSQRGRLVAVWHGLTPSERRGLLFLLLTAVGIVGMLTPASRFAERYIFVANYCVAVLGIVVALRTWPALGARVDAWQQRVPGLPALVWLVLVAARLVVGPLLPRISG